MRKTAVLLIAFFGASTATFAQGDENTSNNEGQVIGNFEITAQSYKEDSIIGADKVDEKMLMNAYANVIYTKGNFEAGIRYEAYLNARLGFDAGYEGTGVPYRYAKYKHDDFEITAGSFYEQFGSGMIFRAYEARGLGYDNAMDGVRVKFNPYKGVYLTGVYGKQRLYFGSGDGIVRGVDGEVNVNELSEEWTDNKTTIILCGSFVSKYQEDRDPLFILPENVGAYGGRVSVIRGGLNLGAEYIYKINDPSNDNGFIYKEGMGMLFNATYSQKGFGVYFGAKMIDNMSYRSDRAQTINNLLINYHPALTKQHTYALAATLYPYGTQPNGEMAAQLEISYKIPKKTKLGGKYGTSITANLSYINGLSTTPIAYADTLDPLLNERLGYETDYFAVGKERYYHDYNIEIRRKINKKFKFAFTYLNILYNMDVVQGLEGKGTVLSDIFVLETTFKLKNRNAIRTEFQHLSVNKDEKFYQDQGDWAFGLIEWTKSPHWFVAVLDQFNYGNEVKDLRVHYITGAVGYIQGSSRITMSYGRQRAGIFCIGGVCRPVPASNGLTLTITSTF